MRPAPAHPRPASGPLDFAWRVHTAQEAWTAKVDVKASVLLALEAGLAIAVISTQGWLAEGSRSLTWYEVLGLVGVVLLLLAGAAAAGAILPVIGTSRGHRHEYGDHYIYFGHLRHWEPDRLAERMAELTATAEIRMLARQVVVMSRLNWRKHRCLQVSVILALLALADLAVVVIAHGLR